MIPLFTVYYDLYQMDADHIWQRIYRNCNKDTAIHNLTLERAEPNQEDRWKAVRVEVKTTEYETNL